MTSQTVGTTVHLLLAATHILLHRTGSWLYHIWRVSTHAMQVSAALSSSNQLYSSAGDWQSTEEDRYQNLPEMTYSARSSADQPPHGLCAVRAANM